MLTWQQQLKVQRWLKTRAKQASKKMKAVEKSAAQKVKAAEKIAVAKLKELAEKSGLAPQEENQRLRKKPRPRKGIIKKLAASSKSQRLRRKL